MKKILLTSALILSIAGLAPASVLGEENTTQSTSAIKESTTKESKKDSIVKEKAESETFPKEKTTEKIKEERPKKEGWSVCHRLADRKSETFCTYPFQLSIL